MTFFNKTTLLNLNLNSRSRFFTISIIESFEIYKLHIKNAVDYLLACCVYSHFLLNIATTIGLYDLSSILWQQHTGSFRHPTLSVMIQLKMLFMIQNLFLLL